MDFIDLKTQQSKIKSKIEIRIRAVLSHGKYIMGPEVFELEEKLADYLDVKHCISCSSGTDAILIPLMAKGVGQGDAIITTPFTYIATAEVISLLGATPVFADIYPETFNINPCEIENAIKVAKEKGLNPKGIIAVDLFGLPARYRLIKKIAKKHDLFVLEDAAQGFGGAIRKQKSGSFGDIGSTSFFPAKPLGAYGDGGAIFTNDDELAIKMQSIRVHGSGLNKYENVRIGINGRLDTLQAAIILEKIQIFDNEIILRNKISKYYSENINSNYQKPFVPSQYLSSWAQYSILAESNEARLEIMKKFKKNKIPFMIYYSIPLHIQKVFQSLQYSKGDFPVSENISNRIFSIPMHPYLNKFQQDKIINILSSIK